MWIKSDCQLTCTLPRGSQGGQDPFYINFIDTEFINNLISQTEQQILMSTPDISDEDLDKALEITSKMTKPHWFFIMGMLGITFMGFIYSLVISFFIKRESKNNLSD